MHYGMVPAIHTVSQCMSVPNEICLRTYYTYVSFLITYCTYVDYQVVIRTSTGGTVGYVGLTYSR